MTSSYLNGNYSVVIRETNNSLNSMIKTAFRINEELIGEFPDSIDLKISNKCFWGCPYCHENSIANGKVFDLEKTKQILEQLPKVPIEIAIGGGNVFESPEETLELIRWLKQNNFRPRITINWRDVIKRIFATTSKTPKIHEILLELDTIGISIDNSIDELKQERLFTTYDNYIWGWDHDVTPQNNILKAYSDLTRVYHVIAGIIDINEFKRILEFSTKYFISIRLLILGFKQFGRAKDMKLPDSIKELESIIKRYIYDCRIQNRHPANRVILGFDNLAIEQLHIKDCLLPEEYDKIYMGDEGNFSMYIDAVNGEFARTSRSIKRISWDEIKLLDFFKELKNDTSNF